MSGKATLILFVFLLTAPASVFAHGGGHSEAKPASTLMEEADSKIDEAVPLNDSIYAINDAEEPEQTVPIDDLMSSPFSSTDLLGTDAPLVGMEMDSGEPMQRFSGGKGTDQKHDQHKQHVETAEHEWVSPQAKGYGIAIGITIISGLVFAGLSFLRIGEGNPKDPS